MFRSEGKIVLEKETASSFEPYAAMEDLLERLKLLNYENLFLSSLKMKPLHRYYFMTLKNPGEQFFLFSSLAAWLIRLLGKNFDMPQEHDDPNDIITNILDVIREMGVTINFPPNKLKQGYGEQVVLVLNQLADQVLKQQQFTFNRPEPPREKEEEREVIDDESEVILDRVEEEMLAAYTLDSDDENVFQIHNESIDKKRNDLEFSNVDLEGWKLELERVIPHLKVTIKNDNRDWRTHLEQIRASRNTILGEMTGTKTHLYKLHKDIASTLETISNRERYLNKELEPILEQYRLLQDQLSKIKDNYKEVSGGVTEKTRQLAVLTDKMEVIKQQMDERGSSMTDGTPLVNIKKAISKIQNEISNMDVQIGVLNTVLLQTKIRENNLLERDLYIAEVV